MLLDVYEVNIKGDKCCSKTNNANRFSMYRLCCLILNKLQFIILFFSILNLFENTLL